MVWLLVWSIVWLAAMSTVALWLVRKGTREGDEPDDAISRVEAGSRLVVTNPGAHTVVVAMTARSRPWRFLDVWRAPLTVRPLRFHERRRLVRGGGLVLGREIGLGVVEAGMTGGWDLPSYGEPIRLLVALSSGSRFRVHEHLV